MLASFVKVPMAYTVSQKTRQNYFCQNLGKFPPILVIFDS